MPATAARATSPTATTTIPHTGRTRRLPRIRKISDMAMMLTCAPDTTSR